MTISGEIIKVLDALCEKFGMVIDWTSQNVLPYLQQLSTRIINYKLAVSYIWIFVLLIPIAIYGFILLKSNKSKKISFEFEYYEYISGIKGLKDGRAWSVIWFLVMTFILMIPITCDIITIATCYVFPEKIIFEFIKGMGLI